MELEHSFTVPVPRSRAWDVLLDVERVAPCMPGATIDSVDGDEIRGRIKVKVGPINMMYAGTARFIEKDAEAGIVMLEASGKETRGAGTASASVRSVLEDRGEETQVTVLTTLNVTGKPAQFGRGVMNEVGGKLLTIFAANLAATLGEHDGAGAGTPEPAAPAPPAAPGAQPDAGAQPAAGAPGTAAGADGPIDDLKLPARAVSSLQRENIATVSQLATKTEDQLLAIDGIGPASVVDIKAKLAEGEAEIGQPAAAAAPGAPAAAAPAAAAPAAAAPAAAAPAAAAPGAAGTAAAGAAVPAAHTATPHQSAPREAAQQLEDDAINLLKVAGMPVLKRAIPIIAALTAALLIGLRRRMRRRHG